MKFSIFNAKNFLYIAWVSFHNGTSHNLNERKKLETSYMYLRKEIVISMHEAKKKKIICSGCIK